MGPVELIAGVFEDLASGTEVVAAIPVISIEQIIDD
jgi:hypothetical protein